MSTENEKRLIDADALDKKLEVIKIRFEAQGRHTVAEDYNFVQTVLLTAPAVDAVEVVHGWWRKGGYACGETEWQCSVCNETEWRTSIDRLKYCPFCGAKMDGGKDHD